MASVARPHRAYALVSLEIKQETGLWGGVLVRTKQVRSGRVPEIMRRF